jgi:regulation of enolase protein 1 (concanavalin A-like superfamily)
MPSPLAVSPLLVSRTLPIFVVVAWLLAAASGFAQTSRDTVVELTATTNSAAPYLTLNWNTAASVTAQKFWRRVKGSTSWGTAIALGTGDVTYADTAALPGVAYEYSFQRTRSVAPTTAYGSLVAGCQVPLVEQRGKVILLVDNTMTTPLAPELSLLEQNLAGDGWKVFRHDVARSAVAPANTADTSYAPRLAEVQAIRSMIQTDYNTAPGSDWALFIVGRVPMPYAGYIAPDGHPDHSGAWSTDAYYGDVNGTWTDTSITNASVTLSDNRNRNVVGDGKFDQSSLPSDVELQTGRVDFLNMGNVPTGYTETMLLRQYLWRDHQFRRGLGAYASVQRRALVDDNFGYFSGEAFAASGWRNAIGFFGRSAGQVDALDWFGTLGTTPMLFAYACGGGSFTAASGVATSTYDFARRDSKAVFTMAFGSYFGDWDATNNYLRAPLAGTQDSLGLACMWSGRGYFHLYHMALGETIGYGARYSQNNNESTATGGWSQNGFNRSIHMGLVGDPTLRLHTVRPPASVLAASQAGGVTLTWQASPDASLGYHVYVGTSATGPFTRLTGGATSTADPAGSPLSAATLTYTHATAATGTAYTYLVKAVKQETSASGSYINLSVGEMVGVTHQGASPVPATPSNLVVAGTGSTSFTLTWQDNASDETGYEVQWRNPSTNVWSTLTTLGANATTYPHSGATAGQPNYYRVRAVNANGSSGFSAEASAYNLPGLVDVRTDFTQVNATAGSVSLPLRRYSGSQGAVSATCVLTAAVGTTGTDFTLATGSATWAHGSTTDFTASVTLPPQATPQLTKIFRVDVSAPLGGLALSSGTREWVQVGDPQTQTLPADWQSVAVGTTGAGYSEYLPGVFGQTVRSGDISAAADSFRMTYRTLNGDCRVTARVSVLSPMASSIRAGVMIRESSAAGSRMNSVLTQIGGSVRRIFRSTLNGTADNATTQSSLPAIIWVRATRTGTDLTTQYSSDGLTWNTIGTMVTLASPTSAMLGGLAICSNNTGSPEVWGYARFDNVEVVGTPEVPTGLVAGYTAAAGHVGLGWSAVNDATGYRIERSTVSGSSFTEIGTTSGTDFTDTEATPDQNYFYRVRANNAVFQSAYSTESSAAALSGIEAWRLSTFGMTGNSGNAADTADPDGDGKCNLVEYVLGSPPKMADAGNRAVMGKVVLNGQDFLTISFARKLDTSGVSLWVEAADSLTGSWAQIDPLSAANQLSVQSGIPASGWETLTIKDVVSIQGRESRYLRLRVTRP